MAKPLVFIMNTPQRSVQSLYNTLSADCTVFTVTDWGEYPKRGALPNAIRCFEQALKFEGPFTIVQDDIEVCKNFGRYIVQYMGMLEQLNMPIMWYSYPHLWNDGWQPSKTLLVQYEPERFLNTQAVSYPSKLAGRIHGDLCEMLGGFIKPDDLGFFHGDDQCIQRSLCVRRREFFVHIPNLVQHVGEESIVAPGLTLYDGYRQSRCYVGRGFDAMQLKIPEPWNYQPSTRKRT